MNKNTLIALAVCFLIFLLWGPLMQKLGWAPAPEETPPGLQEQQDDPAGAEEGGEAGSDQTAPAPSEAAAPDETVTTPDPAVTPGEQTGIENVPVDQQPSDMAQPRARRTAGPTTPLTVPDVLTAYIDRDRGGITRVELHKYLSYDQENRVVLGNHQFPFCAAAVLGRLQDGEVVERTDTRLVLRRETEDTGLVCTETWQLDADRAYRVDYLVSFSNRGEEPMVLSGVGIDVGGLTAETNATAKLGRVGAVDLSADVAVDPRKRPPSFQAKDVADFDADDTRELMELNPVWVAVHNKYFIFLLAADETPFEGCRLTYEERPVNSPEPDDEPAPEEWLAATVFLPRQVLQAGQEKTFRFTAYAGPKEYERLNDFGRGATNVMRLDLFMFWRAGWMGLISRTILKSLIWIRNSIGQEWGYGVAIILITIVIKILFWPLTHKSTVSMRRMQQLQPLMQEIREKYKDDQQLMNQKIMELYREHKVNPLGGCLPILFQIPVFFALFNTLRGAIELRQASFLWVADLSMPDTLPWMPFGFPIRPLAIIMGLSMLLQQRLSPASSNPSQTRMMTFMSFFFMFIFYSMPAGLTLYWTVNQLLTIGQNLVTRKLDKHEK